MQPYAPMSAGETPPMRRTRLACWTALVASIAALNYYARFTSSTTAGRDEVYSWSAFASGLVVYALWLGLVLAIAAAVFACVTLLARLVDWRLARKPLAAEAVTRYRVLRRSVTTSILFVGFFSALLVIPQVRAVAGGLLASSAVLGVIIGFASQ